MPGASLVVPFGAEGAADRAARAVAKALAGTGHEVAIENVPGEGGWLGVRRANALAAQAGAPALLLATPSTHLLLPWRNGAGCGPSPAFLPGLGLGGAPNVLLASPALGARSVDALLAQARARELTYASAGAGQTIHLCTALLETLAGVRLRHRPFDAGSAGAYPELAAGRVHLYFDNLLGCRDRVATGDAVPLAVSSRERSPSLPGVPTLAECGLPGHALDVWFGLFVAEAGDALAGALDALAGDARLAEALAALGLEGGLTRADALARRVDDSAPAWRRALAAASGG